MSPLAQALANMGEVRRAAERRGMSVEEAAERIASTLPANPAGNEQHPETRGYLYMRAVRNAARAL